MLHLRQVVATLAFLLALPLGASGCESEPFQGEIPGCRCEIDRCTSASCGYELRLAADCTGELTNAEILVDGHLEAATLVPGEALVTCSRTEPGVTSQVIVRGGDWVWGPLNERCDDPGTNRLLVLQCIEAF